jgi:hypothetical protein
MEMPYVTSRCQKTVRGTGGLACPQWHLAGQARPPVPRTDRQWGRARCLWLLLLGALAAGCGGGEEEGPLQLGDRWIIHEGEPALLMDGDATDAVRDHFNEEKDPQGRVVSFDYDYSSKKTGESYKGKVYNIRRDFAGKVVYFDVSINGVNGWVKP